MPTYEWGRIFGREFKALDAELQDAFLRAVAEFVDDIEQGRAPCRSLRVKGVEGHRSVYEISWAQNGRATFAYGAERTPDRRHIVWRRIGGHEIFRRP